MGKLHALPLRLRRALNKLTLFARGAPPEAARTTPGQLLWSARVKIGMSQTEAAERAGITQTHWHALESEKTDARLSTWKRAFSALACEMLILPKPRRHLGEWRARRILEGKYSAKSLPTEREA